VNAGVPRNYRAWTIKGFEPFLVTRFAGAFLGLTKAAPVGRRQRCRSRRRHDAFRRRSAITTHWGRITKASRVARGSRRLAPLCERATIPTRGACHHHRRVLR
jgi:hypothetical protein